MKTVLGFGEVEEGGGVRISRGWGGGEGGIACCV